MWRATSRLLLATSLLSALLIPFAPRASGAEGYVALVEIDGTIDAVSSRFLSRALGEANEGGANLVVILLDTPGGRLDSTRDMVEDIIASEVPVVVYVAPSGAQAASAGTFITVAANIAAMAPTTNIGAASPISSSGEDLPSTLAKKVNEDTRAFIRSIAETRGRNAQALEETVTLARAYSASEAVDLNIVDLIAPSLKELLVMVDGLTVTTAAGERVIHTEGVPVHNIEKTFLESFLTVIADPNIAFLLFSIGNLAILAEIYTPGIFAPGAIGIVAIVLALVAFGSLPVNWAAVGLMGFGAFLFFLEMEAPGVSIFGVAGVIAFALGAFFLFGDFSGAPEIAEPAVEVDRWIIGGTGATVLGLVFLFAWMAREGGSPSAFLAGPEASLVGTSATVVDGLAPSGTVRVDGRDWTATLGPDESALAGSEVQVTGVFAGGVLRVTSGVGDGRRPRKPAGSWLRARLGRPVARGRAKVDPGADTGKRKSD